MQEGQTHKFTIEGLGSAGDGYSEIGKIRVYIPMTLPSEVVNAKIISQKGERWLAEVISWEIKSSERQNPPCLHFSNCGGCSLQHLDYNSYKDLLIKRVEHSLKAQGLQGLKVSHFESVSIGNRRRIRLSGFNAGKQIALGYRSKRSHKIVDIKKCLLATNVLACLIKPIRDLLFKILEAKEFCQISLCDTASGVDMLIHKNLNNSITTIETLVDFAHKNDLARLSIEDSTGTPDTIIERKKPIIDYWGMPVTYPSGSFIQPTANADVALSVWVKNWLINSSRVIDLYSGLGGLTSLLAYNGSHVRAVEINNYSINALKFAANKAQLPITTEKRDLKRNPYTSSELKIFDALVFDPPFSGAKSQAEQIAESQIPLVVGISCNPASFARDTAILLNNGYSLSELKVIDQFYYSENIEIAALFKF